MLEQRSHAGKLLKLALLAVVNYAPLFAVTYKTNKDKNTYNMQITNLNNRADLINMQINKSLI